MGRIREYAMLSEMAGDPFRFRLPKKLRKFQPGKALKRIAPSLLPLIPGPVGLAASFARGYGLMAGDPAHPPKRKSAGAGPKAKAAKKAQHRADKAAGKHVSGPAKRRGATSGKHKGITGREVFDVIRDNAGGAIGGIRDVIGAVAGGRSPVDVAGGMIGGEFGGAPIGMPAGGLPRGMHLPGFGRHRRTMNPGNVKALRRAARRFEGFKKLIHTVNKSLPHGMKFHAGPALHAVRHSKRKR